MATSAPVEAVKSAVTSAINTVTGAPTEDAPVESSKDEAPVLEPSSPDARKKLERKLSLRPEREELVERNILKNTTVAPSLQAAQSELARAQLGDALESKLQARPRPEELVKEGILNADEVPGA